MNERREQGQEQILGRKGKIWHLFGDLLSLKYSSDISEEKWVRVLFEIVEWKIENRDPLIPMWPLQPWERRLPRECEGKWAGGWEREPPNEILKELLGVRWLKGGMDEPQVLSLMLSMKTSFLSPTGSCLNPSLAVSPTEDSHPFPTPNGTGPMSTHSSRLKGDLLKVNLLEDRKIVPTEHYQASILTEI